MTSELKKKVAWSLDLTATVLVIWGLLNVDYAGLLRSVIKERPVYENSLQTSEAPGKE